METALTIILSVVGGLIVLFLILKIVFAAVRRRLGRRIRETFEHEEIIRSTVNANYFGLESLGGRQVRGNCALVLTRGILWSSLAVPRRDLPLPLSRIRRTSLVRSHCRRAILLDLLRVDFSAAGADDAIAWYVRDARDWQTAIEAAIRENCPDRPASSL